MSWLSNLFSWRTKVSSPSSEEKPVSQSKSWSFWSSPKPDYTSIDGIKNEITAINNTSFWRQSSLSSRIGAVWKQIEENQKLPSDQEIGTTDIDDKMHNIFEVCKMLQQKEEEMVNSWNNSFWSWVSKGVEVIPSAETKKIQRWVLDKTPMRIGSDKEKFIEDLLEYLALPEDKKNELKSKMKSLDLVQIRELKNNIFSELDRNVNCTAELISEEIEKIINKAEFSENLEDLESKTFEEGGINSAGDTLVSSANPMPSPIVVKHVKGIPNGDDVDCNRCFLNSTFQLIMHTPGLINSLHIMINEFFCFFEADDQIGYRCFLKAVKDYQVKSDDGTMGAVNLTGLRKLMQEQQTRTNRQWGDAAEVLTQLCRPLLNLKDQNLTISQQFSENFPRIVEVKEFEKFNAPLSKEQEKILKRKKSSFLKEENTPVEMPNSNVRQVEVEQSLFIRCEGKQQIKQLFQPQSSQAELSIYKKDSEVSYYKLKTEQMHVVNTPNQLLINVVRGDPGDNRSVDVPVFIYVPKGEYGVEYRLCAAVIRPNSTHYTALVRNPEFQGERGDLFEKDHEWSYVDDSLVIPINSENKHSYLNILKKGVVICSYEKVGT